MIYQEEGRNTFPGSKRSAGILDKRLIPTNLSCQDLPSCPASESSTYSEEAEGFFLVATLWKNSLFFTLFFTRTQYVYLGTSQLYSLPKDRISSPGDTGLLVLKLALGMALIKWTYNFESTRPDFNYQLKVAWLYTFNTFNCVTSLRVSVYVKVMNLTHRSWGCYEMIHLLNVVVESLSHVWLFGDPMNCSLPGPSVHGIFQARILDWVAISFSKDLLDPGIQPASPAWQVDSYPLSHQGNPYLLNTRHLI